MAVADTLANKQKAIAKLLDGEVVDTQGRVAVCVKGTIMGYHATYEAIYPSWPFGSTYIVESCPGVDPSAPPTRPCANITICPRVGRGVSSLLTNILLFEGGGMKVHEKALDNAFNFTYNNKEIAQRFAHQEGVQELLLALDETARFSEAVVRTDAGIYLSQPKSFNSLNLDHCQEVFELLGRLAEILAENF